MARTVRIPVLFLELQAVLVAGWWLMLWLAPDTRKWFAIGGWPEATLFAFVLPDAVLLVGGSILTAIGLLRGTRWAMRAFGVVIGAALYALLYCCGAASFTGDGKLGIALMALCVGGNVLMYRMADR